MATTKPQKSLTKTFILSQKHWITSWLVVIYLEETAARKDEVEAENVEIWSEVVENICLILLRI